MPEKSFIYSAMEPQLKRQVEEYHTQRFLQLHSLVVSSAEGAWQFLMAVNGGGAVAVLAFIGAVQPLQKRWWPYVVLFVFVVGLVLVGVGRAYVFQRMTRLMNLWNGSMARLYDDQVDWLKVLRDDQTAANKREWVAVSIGWASFGTFIAGLAALCVCFAAYGVPGGAT